MIACTALPKYLSYWWNISLSSAQPATASFNSKDPSNFFCRLSLQTEQLYIVTNGNNASETATVRVEMCMKVGSLVTVIAG
jgi:hypothetical protein